MNFSICPLPSGGLLSHLTAGDSPNHLIGTIRRCGLEKVLFDERFLSA